MILTEAVSNKRDLEREPFKALFDTLKVEFNILSQNNSSNQVDLIKGKNFSSYESIENMMKDFNLNNPSGELCSKSLRRLGPISPMPRKS